jgi:hypothetical protein
MLPGIAGDPEGLLFRTTGRKTGKQHPMRQQDSCRMIQRRPFGPDAGIKTRIGNHSWRATGITEYLKNKGTLETAQHCLTLQTQDLQVYYSGLAGNWGDSGGTRPLLPPEG